MTEAVDELLETYKLKVLSLELLEIIQYTSLPILVSIYLLKLSFLGGADSAGQKQKQGRSRAGAG